MSPTPPARVRLTVAKRAVADIAMERDPTARLSKYEVDLDAEFVNKYLRVQAAAWEKRAELHRRTGL